MSAADEIRVDRTAIEVVSLNDAPNDRRYWMSKSPTNRLWHDPATARLSRVLDIVPLDWL